MQKQDRVATAALPGPVRQHTRMIDNAAFIDSDVRATGVSGRCALCGNERRLRLSHIVPRWAHQWMKKEGVPIREPNIYEAGYKVQDGSKHYLLCDECEQHLGQAEQYLSLLARGTRADLKRADVGTLPGPILVGVNNTLVMRGLLGILYKLHFARSKRIALDGRFVSRLRDRLLNDDYPRHSLYLAATKWLSCKWPDINPRAIVTFELTNSPKFLDLLMGGMSWTLAIASPGRLLKDKVVSECLLRPGEPWLVPVADILHHRYFEPTDYYSRVETQPWLKSPTHERTWAGFDAANP